MRKRTLQSIFIVTSLLVGLAFAGCKKQARSEKEGVEPFSKESVKIGIIFPNELDEVSFYDWMHYRGIVEMQQKLDLDDSQLIMHENVFEERPSEIEAAVNECISEGANIIIGASWNYLDTMKKLAEEMPQALFVHMTGSEYRAANFITASVKAYEARYLTGMIAGSKTKTNKVGFVAAMGKENYEVTSGLDAFAMGVESVNPDATVYVKVIHSWIDTMGETDAANYLIDRGCDVITHHTNTANPMIAAEKRGVLGIGFNSDMSFSAPDAVMTSIVINWGVFYTQLVASVIDGTFTATPYFEGLAAGVVDITNMDTRFIPEALAKRVKAKRQEMIDGTFKCFSGTGGKLYTDTGELIKIPADLTESAVYESIDWYYRNIVDCDVG
ncbi:MAG: BMP family ABC transporter substrate-binding protein [Treponemataceae bacterium]|nr:MAG: BMP family ABC transporter substrate-binding protein [Treponemataceae bacterium]